MYTSKLPTNRIEWQKVRAESGDAEDPLDGDRYATAMVKVSILADRCLATAFRKAVNNQAVDYFIECEFPTWFCVLSIAFAKLPEENGLLRLLIDISCIHCGKRDYLPKSNGQDDALLLKLPAALLLKMLGR